MLGTFIDRTGEVFGELTVLYCTQRASRNPPRKTLWMCRCSCGHESEYQTGNLSSGNSTCCINCRGENQVIHGHSRRGGKGVSTYNSWLSMKERCDNPNYDHYKNYGGRGITYDIRWKDFNNFLMDMVTDLKG